jgi:hypothetical protein
VRGALISNIQAGEDKATAGGASGNGTVFSWRGAFIFVDLKDRTAHWKRLNYVRHTYSTLWHVTAFNESAQSTRVDRAVMEQYWLAVKALPRSTASGSGPVPTRNFSQSFQHYFLL